MSLEAITWAFRQEIPPTAKLVLMALANRADDETGDCWPGLTRVAKDASCSIRSAQIHIAALARNGFIQIERKFSSGDGRQRSNHYWLLFDRAPAPWKSVKAEQPDDDQDVVGGGADSAPHTITTEGDFDDGISHQDSPPPVNQDSSPCIEPSGIEPIPPEQVDGPRLQQAAMPASPPQALAQAKRPQAAFDGSKPHRFDPNARQAKIQAAQAAEVERRSSQRVFVIEGSRAWKAWLATRPQGFPTTVVNGQRGWHFPQCFPPPAKGPGDRTMPQQSPASPETESEYFPDLAREMGG